MAVVTTKQMKVTNKQVDLVYSAFRPYIKEYKRLNYQVDPLQLVNGTIIQLKVLNLAILVSDDSPELKVTDLCVINLGTGATKQDWNQVQQLANDQRIQTIISTKDFKGLLLHLMNYTKQKPNFSVELYRRAIRSFLDRKVAELQENLN